MWRPLEMYVASRMQNRVQIRARHASFATKLHFTCFVATIILRLSALRAPTVGPLVQTGRYPGYFVGVYLLGAFVPKDTKDLYVSFRVR